MKINWDERLSETPLFGNIYATFDCTDCSILEPRPFSKTWYSFKLHGSGLRYEIAISISDAHIVWVNGPYKCGVLNDLQFFQQFLASKLIGERVIADKIYRHPNCMNPSDVTDDGYKKIHSRIRARHETVNSRFKNFAVLGQSFRHAVNKHFICFHAVAQIVSLMIKTTDPLFV